MAENNQNNLSSEEARKRLLELAQRSRAQFGNEAKKAEDAVKSASAGSPAPAAEMPDEAPAAYEAPAADATEAAKEAPAAEAGEQSAPAQPAPAQTLRQRRDFEVRAAEEAKAAALALEAEEQRAAKVNAVFFRVFMSITVILVAFLAGYLFFLSKKQPEPEPEPEPEVPVFTMYDVGAVTKHLTPNCPDGTEFPDGMLDKFKPFYAYCGDFAGWLSVPGTCIDSAFVQNPTDSMSSQYYLKRDLQGNYSRYGIVFADFRNDMRDLNRNTIIYGHNFDDDKDGVADDLIFGDIEQYLDVEFYKQHPTLKFSTPYKEYDAKIIACMLTNGDSTGDNGYLFNYIATQMSDGNFLAYIDELAQRSWINTTVDVQGEDKIVTLSTCSYQWDRGGALQNLRCVLVARLTRDGEDPSVDTSGATQNENPRFPQLYYNIFGGSNPYSASPRWYPDM